MTCKINQNIISIVCSFSPFSTENVYRKQLLRLNYLSLWSRINQILNSIF